jgi:CubicO group peptidase (beta-lactamase class C family)
MDGYLTSGGAYYGVLHWNNAWPPGTRYEYTNAGAGLAGDLVERISGEDLQTYCETNIFGPLGMTETSWFLADLTPAQQADIATPYSYYADGGLYADPLLGWPTYPDGQLRSSAPQLAQFLLAFANQGTLGAAQLVQPATASEMMTEQVGGVGEGLFWESLYEGQSGQYYVIGHGGLFTGYSTEMYFDPMTGAGYICLMNSDVGGLSSTAATSALANINNELLTVAEEAP